MIQSWRNSDEKFTFLELDGLDFSSKRSQQKHFFFYGGKLSSRLVHQRSLGSARPHVDLLVQHCDLILDAVLFALQSLLGDAFDGHQPLSPLLLSQVDLREGPTATQKHTFRTPAAASELFVAGSHLCIRYMCRT